MKPFSTIAILHRDILIETSWRILNTYKEV